jgi:hypothetical protein
MIPATRICSLLLALFTLVGSAGIPVFIHQCKEDGVFRSFFVRQAMHCELEKANELPPCCARKELNSKHEKADSHCCDERTDFFKVKFESKQDCSIHLKQGYLPSSFKNYTVVLEPTYSYESRLAGWINRPPPKPTGQELLILYQNFRI